SPMQVAHAKSLIQIVLGEIAQIAGLCLLVRGVTGTRRWLIAAAAVPLALCLYTYHSTKIAPLVAIPYLVAAMLAARRTPPPIASEGGARSSIGRWALACLGLFLACAVLFIRSWILWPDRIGGRIAGTSVWSAVREEGWGALWDSVWRTLAIF